MLNYGITKNDLAYYYELSFKVCKDSKLKALQFKIIPNILPSRSFNFYLKYKSQKMTSVLFVKNSKLLFIYNTRARMLQYFVWISSSNKSIWYFKSNDNYCQILHIYTMS
jgi:hypothetical protein